MLDKLFPKFLKGNILLLHGSWTFSPEALPSPIPTPLSGRWKTWISLCDLKSGSQFPCLQDGEVRTVCESPPRQAIRVKRVSTFSGRSPPAPPPSKTPRLEEDGESLEDPPQGPGPCGSG